MRKIYLSLTLTSIAFILASYSSGPGASGEAATGAPGENNCTSCHSSHAVNSGNGSITINFNNGTNSYVPGQTYNIVVAGTGSTANKYGFQITALKSSDNTTAGTFTAGTGSKKSTVGNRNYLEHSSRSTTGVWSFQWTAPNTDVGNIKFYVAGNSCENPSGDSGDNIYTNTITINPTSTAIELVKQENESTILAYPTPTSNNLNVKFKLSYSQLTSIQILNIEGKLVSQPLKDQMLNVGENQFSISTEGLDNGQYFVKIIGEKENLTAKFLVLK